MIKLKIYIDEFCFFRYNEHNKSNKRKRGDAIENINRKTIE